MLALLQCSVGCGQGTSQPLAPGTAIVQQTANLDEILKRAGEDWPIFLGPRSDGTSAEVGIDPELWDPHPPLLWSMKLGVGYATPTISQGKLLIFDRHGDFERLTCFDAVTAKQRWVWESKVLYEDQYGYNNGPRCCPIVDGNRVYTYGVAGQLSCVELATGELLWSQNLNQQYNVVQNFFGVASTPFVYEDKLLVMVGGSPENGPQNVGYRLDLIQPNDSTIVAFDKITGKEIYKVGNDLASYSSVTVRQVGQQMVGLAFARGGLLGWEPETGTELFQFPWRADMLESVNASQPVVDGNRILISEAYDVGSVLLEWKDERLSVLRQDKGTRNKLSFRAHWSTPVLVDGYLYGCNGRNEPDSDFRCVSFEDGEVQWRERRHERSSVLLADGYLIVLGEHGNLELIQPNPNTCEVLAAVDLSETQAAQIRYPCWAAPVLSHGLLYVRGKDTLLCFDLIPAE